MSRKSIILVGGPETGKSNYIGRLWLALNHKKFGLISPTPPQNLQYVEELSAHLLRNAFAPRTEPNDTPKDFQVTVQSTRDSKIQAELLVPDVRGEVWKTAVKNFELPNEWFDMLQNSASAILFMRIRSPLNVQPLDWVNSQRLLRDGMGDQHDQEIPTQVNMIELLRFLEENLTEKDSERRVAVVLTAWDMLSDEEASEGPIAYLVKQFPMFAGRLKDTTSVKIKVFGLSIVGGNFEEKEFANQMLAYGIQDTGYVIRQEDDGTFNRYNDITEPVRWLLDEL